jgi:hypothetical protein
MVMSAPSSIPILPIDEAVWNEGPVVLVEGQVSDAALEVSAKLLDWHRGGKLPMYVHTVRQTLDEGWDGEGNSCHDNTLALAGDIWKLPHKDWTICVGERGSRGPHSWMEYGGAAIDATYNVIVVSRSDFHRTYAKVLRAQTFSGASGWKYYLHTLKALGLVPHG